MARFCFSTADRPIYASAITVTSEVSKFLSVDNHMLAKGKHTAPFNFAYLFLSIAPTDNYYREVLQMLRNRSLYRKGNWKVDSYFFYEHVCFFLLAFAYIELATYDLLYDVSLFVPVHVIY